MSNSPKIDALIKDLPDPEGVRRFFERFSARHPIEAEKLMKSAGLLSDLLTLAGFSPLLAQTILQNPAYVSWLARKRTQTSVCSKEDFLESLARFALTNTELDPQIVLSRFRRREMLAIYLRDIRRLMTISETTEEISNLADAILEYALRMATQELENRYGNPQEFSENNRPRPASFSVVSLGKLGSKELNYASDIDLLFLYSYSGETSGHGTKGKISNREYFIKLAESISKIVGGQSGEGAAYRVDLRLRPYGRVGTLAISLNESIRYYRESAQAWERQMLIRARSSAGDAKLFKKFYTAVEANIYPLGETVENALRNVKLSKDKINLNHELKNGYNVKLGKGGIREIEFIAQALQIAHGGSDAWLRAAHTLISLARLADRNLIAEKELDELFDAYEFLRRLEHRLQMENGLQTHIVPNNLQLRDLIARRMDFENLTDFDAVLNKHTNCVEQIFERVFGESQTPNDATENLSEELKEIKGSTFSKLISVNNLQERNSALERMTQHISAALEKSEASVTLDINRRAALNELCQTSRVFAELLSANPNLIINLPTNESIFQPKDYFLYLRSAVSKKSSFHEAISALRIEWSKLYLEIAALDIFGKLELSETKKLQTELAEATLKTALLISQNKIAEKLNLDFSADDFQIPFSIFGLGKLGGRGMDYGSDLDLVLIYNDKIPLSVNETHAQFYSRFVEILVTCVSSFTRDGNLYRMDLRLRPDGKNGTTSLGKTAFLNYLDNRAAIWEFLAYVKLRGVCGDEYLTTEAEAIARRIIHEKAARIDHSDLKSETLRLRERLELEKSGAGDVNIKFSQGGLLDVYFATRFLQLRDNVPDQEFDRSTQATLRNLLKNKSLSEENYSALATGHDFLNRLDHNLRLTVGRVQRLPMADAQSLEAIARRMKVDSVRELLETLAFKRMEIRAAFEDILR